ncbi:MAG: hypothetical protein ACOX2O_01140 [Bdellovibrionota bacterium]
MDDNHRIALNENFLPVSEIVKETGIKLPKKLNDMLGDTARRAIKCELNEASEKMTHNFHNIGYLKNRILSVLEISEKTGIDPTNKQNERIEEIAKYIIRTELAEVQKWAARKDYNSAAYSMLLVLELVKRTGISLTNEENTMIKEIAPDMIQDRLERALGLLGKGCARESLDYARRALKIAEETKTDLTEEQKKMIEDFAPKIIQAYLEEALRWLREGFTKLPLDNVRRVLKFAEKTKTDLTEEQKEVIENIALDYIQYELVHASRNADIGKSTDAVLSLLYAFKIAEETGTHFNNEWAEMEAVKILMRLMRLDKNFRGFIALSS